MMENEETAAQVLWIALACAFFFFVVFRYFRMRKTWKRIEGELRGSRAFLDSVLENLPNMVFVKEARTLRFIRFNRAGEELLGYSKAELLGKNDYDFFPREQADFFTSKDRAVLSGSVIVDIPEEEIETRHKGKRILHTRKIPIFDSDGSPQYLLGISEDITEWKRAERDRLRVIREQAALEERERVTRRMAFLADVSTLLASSLDSHEALRKLADGVVSTFGEWCAVTLIGDDGGRRRIAAVHRDPGRLVLEAEEAIDSVLSNGEAAERTGGEGAALVAVPIASRGRVLGALAVGLPPQEARDANQDRTLIEEIGRRAGIAIENARLYEAAQSAVSARDEFLSIASHELKTPITALKLQLEIARRATRPEEGVAPPPEKLARMLDLGSVQVNRLTTLIDDLLDVSRIEAGKLVYEFDVLDLSALARELVERYREHALAGGCSVSVLAPSPVYVKADRFRMEQVLLNLLTNAVKYGAKKPIRISVTSEGGVARVTCEDHGIGIAHDRVGQIFERFERAVSAKNISGLGLGLYITREIVKAHRGSVQVRTEPGLGSTFEVDLPLWGKESA